MDLVNAYYFYSCCKTFPKKKTHIFIECLFKRFFKSPEHSSAFRRDVLLMPKLCLAFTDAV